MVAIFLLTKVQDPLTPEQKKVLEASLSKEFPDFWREAGNGTYLVATSKPMIPQDISGSLGISVGNAGSYIVTVMEPYYGWAGKAIWDWMKTVSARDGHP